MSKSKRKNQRQRKKRKLKDGRGNSIMDWAGLPRDILVMIFEQLSLVDCMSVDNVCKLWSNILAELPNWKRGGFPWLLMSGQKDREMRTCSCILDNRIWEMELLEAYGAYVWGSFQDWLIIVKELGCYSLEVSLLNPFSVRKINLPRLWNFYHKMVLSGSPTEENTICAAIHSQNREIAFWVQGSEVWHKYKLEGTPFEDAVFCNGSLFLLCNDGKIFQIEATSIISNIRENEYVVSISEIEAQFHELRSLEINSQHVLKYLVESSGDVLLVCRYFSKKPDAVLETINFEIYSLDLSQMSWERVECLDDRILFLGKCCSRSLSSTELGIAISNCIYFSNDDIAPWWNEWDSNHLKGLSSLFGLDNSSRKDWGTFHIDRDNNGKFCFRGNRDNWAPIWFTAPLWWYSKNIARQSNRYRQM
ncbi:unnamed protein product [Citrullus colocynthis]|uniref:F-box domain-containing protein n=1 Tax=Citrullus colocynthis TaxID=252529 RepID=A0ABP0YBD1_9ROSI